MYHFVRCLILWGAILFIFLSGCNINPELKEEPEYNIDPTISIKILSDSLLPFVHKEPWPLDYNYPSDPEGVILYEYRDSFYYNPTQIAGLLLHYIESYSLTHIYEYLRRAETFANKLIEISVKDNQTMFFPFKFNFYLHDLPEDVMIQPWYSGMAQGIILASFVRLYQLTGKEEYMEFAHRVFNSFRYLRRNYPNKWFTLIDEEGYLWIEEYPKDDATHALNGFIFAIFGLYYYLETRDPSCENLLKGTITTIKNYINLYRNEGDISYYCLKHKVKSTKYHMIHIDQMLKLYYITGDTFFLNMHDALYSDYHK